MRKLWLPVVFVGFIPMCQEESVADTIRVGTETYENVYVLENDGEYNILIPTTGETVTVSSKRTDVELVEKSDEGVRQRLHDAWTSKNAMREAAEKDDPRDTTGDGVPDPTDDPPAVITNEVIAATTQLEETAEFETQLMLWAQLDAVVREQIFNATAAAARSDVLFNMGRVRAMQEVRQQNEQAIEREVAEFQEVAAQAESAANEAQAEAAAELARAQNMAGWNYIRGGIRNRVVIDDAEPFVSQVDGGLISTGRLNLGRIYWDPAYQGAAAEDVLASGAAVESATRAAALSDEAAGIATDVAAAAEQTQNRVEQLEAQNAEAAVDEARMRIETEDRLARAQRELAKMQALEDAFLGGYELTIPFTTLREIETVDANEATLDVEVTSPVWRVLWAVSGPAAQSSGFLVSVVDGEGKPVGGGGDAGSAYGRYLLLDGPGRFTIKVRGTNGSRCVVVAEQAEEVELPQQEPAEVGNPAESPARVEGQ